MIWLDDEGRIVIRSSIKNSNYEEHHNRILAVLDLLKTQEADFINKDTSYYAFSLLEDMLPNPEHIDETALKMK